MRSSTHSSVRWNQAGAPRTTSSAANTSTSVVGCALRSITGQSVFPSELALPGWLRCFRLALAEAFVGDGVAVALDQHRAFAVDGTHERLAVLEAHARDVNQRQGFGGFLAQRVEPPLHCGHLVG